MEKRLSTEQKIKIGNSNRGKKHSEKQNKQNGIFMKKWWAKPENHKRQSDAHKGNGGYWKGKTIPKYAREKMRLAKLGKYDLEKHPQWQGGKSFEPYTLDWTETLRRSIRERDKYTCCICGKEPSIHCHHIDYDKKNCNPDNLITLCNSCHVKTNHNRDYWIGYFKNI